MPYRTGARINSHLAGESFDPRPCLDFGFTHYLQGKFLFLNPWDSESDLSVSNMYLIIWFSREKGLHEVKKSLAEAPRKPRAWWVKVGGAVRVSPFHPTVFCPLKAAWPITAAEIPDISVTSFACNGENHDENQKSQRQELPQQNRSRSPLHKYKQTEVHPQVDAKLATRKVVLTCLDVL